MSNPLVPYEEYFVQIAKTGNPATTAEDLGLSPRDVKDRLKTDPEFLAKYEHALDLFKEAIESEVRNRAFGNKGDPIRDSKGRVVGYSAGGEKPDNRLLLALAKRRIPEYKEGTNIDVKVSTGVVVVKEPSKNESEWRERFEVVQDPPDETTGS